MSQALRRTRCGPQARRRLLIKDLLHYPDHSMFHPSGCGYRDCLTQFLPSFSALILLQWSLPGNQKPQIPSAARGWRWPKSTLQATANPGNPGQAAQAFNIPRVLRAEARKSAPFKRPPSHHNWFSHGGKANFTALLITATPLLECRCSMPLQRPADLLNQSIVKTILTAKRHQRIKRTALGLGRRLCTKLPAA